MTKVSIHAHDVMHMIAATKRALPKAEWVCEINSKYGSTARFNTCAARNLNAAELLDCIHARGKFEVVGDIWSLDVSKICTH